MTTNDGSKRVYNRIVLKLSGEALAGESGFGIDPDRAETIADRIKTIHDLGIQVAVVIGGGNLWRGAIGVSRGMDQATSDHMGMLGTVMNGLALQDALERLGIVTRVQTAIEMKAVAEPYIRLRAVRHLEKGRVVIIAGGLGNPYFTTDTAAALRAAEINADIVIKGTKVNGVYSSDPEHDPAAVRFDRLSFQQVIENQYRVMDMTAVTLCQENQMPILVVDFWAGDDLFRAVQGESTVGTLIANG